MLIKEMQNRIQWGDSSDKSVGLDLLMFYFVNSGQLPPEDKEDGESSELDKEVPVSALEWRDLVTCELPQTKLPKET